MMTQPGWLYGPTGWSKKVRHWIADGNFVNSTVERFSKKFHCKKAETKFTARHSNIFHHRHHLQCNVLLFGPPCKRARSTGWASTTQGRTINKQQLPWHTSHQHLVKSSSLVTLHWPTSSDNVFVVESTAETVITVTSDASSDYEKLLVVVCAERVSSANDVSTHRFSSA